MMQAMQTGRHKQQAEKTFDPSRYLQVCMSEDVGKKLDDLVGRQHDGRQSAGRSHQYHESGVENDFQRMITKSRRNIEVNVTVVHPVQPPQQRHFVVEKVKDILRKTSGQDGRDQRGPPRHTK